MLEILQFVFSGFWTWLGSAFMLLIISQTAWAVVQGFLVAIQARLK